MPRKQPASNFLWTKHAMLTITADLGIVNKYRRVQATCDCGTSKSYRLADIQHGGSTNCGCVRNAINKDRSTHGASQTGLYKVWRGIKERCYYPRHIKYSRYGGRGISVCDEWIKSFESFRHWALSNGYREGLEIDRIDNNGNYSPDNCRWATIKENRRNRSTNRLLLFKGEKKCMSEWAEITGIDQGVIKDRINKLKWTVDKALTTPIKSKIC